MSFLDAERVHKTHEAQERQEDEEFPGEPQHVLSHNLLLSLADRVARLQTEHSHAYITKQKSKHPQQASRKWNGPDQVPFRKWTPEKLPELKSFAGQGFIHLLSPGTGFAPKGCRPVKLKGDPMTFRQKSLVFPAWLPAAACLLVLLFGAAAAGAQIRTVLVSPVPGNPIASGTALRNALAGIPSPSATNRWLVKVEPGIYDVGNTSLDMRSWVDIEGSGIGMTTITGSLSWPPATLHGANNSELRMLTVEAVGTAAAPDVIAMANYDASPRIYRVKLSAVGQLAWGMRNVNAAPLIEECEIQARSTSTTNTDSYGVVFRGGPPPAGRSSILRSRIAASGARTNYGIFITEGQAITEIRDSRIDATGGTTSHGVYAFGGQWSTQESLQIRNTEINSAGASSASYGINIDAIAWVALDINGSKVWGHVAPTTYGIRNTGQGPMGLQSASVVGFTQTIQTTGSASIASTLLNGGPATASGWLGCMGVWDENGVFYAQGCP